MCWGSGRRHVIAAGEMNFTDAGEAVAGLKGRINKVRCSAKGRRTRWNLQPSHEAQLRKKARGEVK
jgi:hypothetical protein